MSRLHALVLAAVLTCVPLTDVAAQSRGQSHGRSDREAPRGQSARPSEAAPRIDARAAVRRVSAGREGRMLGVRQVGDTIIIRWEYPGGQVADIRVDGRTGQIN